MTEKRSIRIEPGNPLIPGVTKIAGKYNIAAEIPEKAEASILLYKKKTEEPPLEISFKNGFCAGNIRAVCLSGFRAGDYEYNFCIDGRVVQDPCAYRIRGREHFGEIPDPENPHSVRCSFLSEEAYDWEEEKTPEIPYQDMILYKLHVRGFTKQARIAPKKRGTFQGLTEMIPYLKELGVNSVELMPAYEFAEISPAVRNKGFVSIKKEKKINYWGYLPGFYFAPKSSYCATDRPEREFRDLVKALHRAGMECIMEFYFPGDVSPLTALRAVQFWKLYYHVDGFHLVGDGVPLSLFVKDAVLSRTKLMMGQVPVWEIPGDGREGRYLSEYNPGFLQDMRRFLKSDEDSVQNAASRLRENAASHAIIHYMACQDGFTLADTVSYNYRHNEDNGENNQDGSSYNYSWNCGVEGPCRKAAINHMREQQMKNAFLMLLLSQGVPMIYGGDEIANSQSGNNNAYCQDNPVGWVDWKGLKKNKKLLAFVKNAIAFRKEHPVLHQGRELKGVDYLVRGFPDISFHGERAWYYSGENTSRLLGVLYCGAYGEKEDHSPDDSIYAGFNFHWETRSLALPNLPDRMVWKKVIDTSESSGEDSFRDSEEAYKKTIEISPRTIVVLVGRQEA